MTALSYSSVSKQISRFCINNKRALPSSSVVELDVDCDGVLNYVDVENAETFGKNEFMKACKAMGITREL